MRRSYCIAIAVFAVTCCLITGTAFPVTVAAETPVTAAAVAPIGERFGAASSHLKLYDAAAMETELDAMQEAGITWVRCNFAWHDQEPVEGSWYFNGTDLVVEKAQQHGVKILGILGGSPPWANGGNPWNYPPTDMAAWSNYVRTMCSRYRGKVHAWEVWNEENIVEFWGSGPDPALYTALLKAACEEIRAADPGVTIVMGGLAGGLSFEYLDSCLQAGAADYVDAIAYHPYPQTLGTAEYTPQEEKCRLIVDYMRFLISQYTSRDIQLWITEFGWTTCTTSPPGVDADTQASYMLRTLINYATTDVERVIYYSLRDEPGNTVDQYGLLDYGFTAKSSLGYYSTFEDVFGPASSVDKNAVTFSCKNPSTLEAHTFRLPDGGLALAAWKSDDAGDSLSLTVNDPAYGVLHEVDPLTAARLDVPGVTRDASGRIVVTALPVGKRPVILEMEKTPPGPAPEASTFYFAEGYTGEGFQEYLCLGNMDAVDAAVDITFLFSGGTTQSLRVMVPAGSRSTVDVNTAVGAGREVAMVVTSRQDIVAERPMYFSYGKGWTGGHDVVGLKEPATTFYFAEGYTGEGFDAWLCVLNPGDAAATLTCRFQTEEAGEKVVSGLTVAPHSRASFKANDLLDGSFQASCVVGSNRPVVVERPMYFDYLGRGAHHWQGGHCVMGSTSLTTGFFFAEGTTRAGFEEWLTLQNPHDSAIDVRAVYDFGPGQGESAEKTYRVQGGRRLTVFVPDEVGWEKDVSIKLSSDSDFLAERPMYFDYTGAGAGHWQGGHCVIGAFSASSDAFFAEGYTGDGFHEWLCLQNPGDGDAVVEVTYLTQERGALPPRTVTVPSRTRITLFVNQHAGAGYQLSCRLRVVSGPPVVAERPMYFSQGGRDGGHDVIGYDPR